MRIILGPVRAEEIESVRRLYQSIPEELVFYTPEVRTLADILALCPAGWQPDVLIHSSLEYNLVPEGIEEAGFLTVATVGDWNLGGQAYNLIGGAFDLLITDHNGCERLRAAGFANVLSLPLFSADPNLEWNQPQPLRDLDITMAGNLAYEVQRERTRWIGRVAKLSRKYRVEMRHGLYGADYVRLMNRTKIVFNRSIRGELNMRVYEAALSGALVFYERENAEIRNLFTDRESCVLYGDDDLETLLDYYLAPENAAERERTAEAGRQVALRETRMQRMVALLDVIRSWRESVPTLPPRPFRAASPAERDFRRAYQWLCTPIRSLLEEIEVVFARTQQALPEHAEIANAWFCAVAEQAFRLNDGPIRLQKLQQAARAGQFVVRQFPGYATAWFNLAQVQIALAHPEAARTLGTALQLLQAPTLQTEQLRGPYLPHDFKSCFYVEMEAVWTQSPPDTEGWGRGMRDLMLWRVWEQLSAIAFGHQQFASSAEFAANAVALRPDIGTAHYRLACALRKLGQTVEAEAAYRRALDAMPLSMHIWEELTTLLQETAQWEKCRETLEEAAAIMNGCPYCAWWRSVWETYWAVLPSATKDAPPSKTIRLLAFPDWEEPQEWQALLRRYAEAYCPNDPVTLLLPAEPTQIEGIVGRMERFLSETLRLTFEEFPDVTLLAKTKPGEAEVLEAQADALVLVGNPTEAALETIPGLTRLSLEDLPAPIC